MKLVNKIATLLLTITFLSSCSINDNPLNTPAELINVNIETFTLYNNAIPDALDNINHEKIRANSDNKPLFLLNVSHPTITAYFPKNANGTAVIICPGGGYKGLSIASEGADIAQRLSALGVTAFVLKYRIPQENIMQDKSIAPLQDLQQAINLVRERSAAWSIQTNKIGVMGFSAGGHLAASGAVHYNDAKLTSLIGKNLRPDFQILVYPVISFTEKLAHKGSRMNLLGKASQNEIDYFSNEKHVTKATPPAFIVHAADDKRVNVFNSVTYFTALQNKAVASQLLILPTGGHGFGLKNSYNWFNNLHEWLNNNQLL